jgi:ribosomal protein S4
VSEAKLDANFFSRKTGRWEHRPVSKMTRDELREALRSYVDNQQEYADRAKASHDERVRLGFEVEQLRADKVKLECRLDATLYAMVLMQHVLQAREKELRNNRGDSLAVAG